MAGDVLAEFVYNDGNGAAQINVSMAFRQDGADGVDDSCNPSDPVYTETCRTTPDGSRDRARSWLRAGRPSTRCTSCGPTTSRS